MKRFLDIVISVSALIILAPLLFIIAGLILAAMGRPVFFIRRRPGLMAKPFSMIKFRTMDERRDAAGAYLPDAERLTPLGTFLRKFSLDELPQLFNVLKGEMSLVGPRPLAMVYLERYSPEQARRHLVRPGITGWAQVNGRNLLDWDSRFAFDTWYVDHHNLGIDFKILFLTFVNLFRFKQVMVEGQSAAAGFKGKAGSGSGHSRPAPPETGKPGGKSPESENIRLP